MKTRRIKMSVNKELLKKVRDIIVEEPKRLNMRYWGVHETLTDPVFFTDKIEYPSCGTVACLAGWTILAQHPRENWKRILNVKGGAFGVSIAHEAIEALGLHEEYYETLKFF